MAIKYNVCLDCGSNKSAKIIYGMPTHEVKPKVERGDIILGGCSLPETHKDYQCKSCGFEWSKEEAVDDAYRKITSIKANIGGFFGNSYEIEWRISTGEVTHLYWEISREEDPVTFNTTYHNAHYLDSIKSINLLRWKRDYQPEEMVLDGTSWSVEIEKGDKVISKHGCNAYPKTWEQFCELMEEVSGKTFN
ncbi:hypothetical protein [Guptibacillus algicola]|uniref:hypothetical protein n=1 Tax=Guptibacillus algicola TaxID=225844 RepID=UPI001CD659A7|nr:hypothetical protein [Alkalihalobacillus algicola]MCA0989293.1 hypothetical protein [Alkalihalobacillus algicola]